MSIRPIQLADAPEWLRMRTLLFPECAEHELAAEVDEYWSTSMIRGFPTFCIVAPLQGRRLAGFVEVSIRPIADGCSTSRIAYIECLFVDADQRRRGIARQLIAAAEEWAVEHGCTELASDCDRHNLISLATHLHLGFNPADDLLHFRKQLRPTLPTAAPTAIEAPRNPDGSTGNWLAILPDPLPIATAIQFVSDASAGGIDVFLGTTRSQASPSGQTLVALDYEAYVEMAQQQLADLAKRCRSRWPVERLAILHRTGRVPLAHSSVVIAVSTPHRADAFTACRFLIDTLKAEVAIWKKEVWADGSGTWVEGSSQSTGPSRLGS